MPPINLWSFPRNMNTPYDFQEQTFEMLKKTQSSIEYQQKQWAQTQQNKNTATGRKDDSEKVRMDLLDPLALEGLAAVLTFGAKKYASWNWAGGIQYSRIIAAMLRHTFAILKGEYTDPESGLPHIDHVGCCWMFLSHMMKVRTEMNDLPKRNKDGALEVR